MAAIKKGIQKVDPNAVLCKSCRKMAVPQYKVTFGDGKFCSLGCLKTYFCNLECINYENHKIANS